MSNEPKKAQHEEPAKKEPATATDAPKPAAATDAPKPAAKQPAGEPMSEYAGFEGEKKLKVKLKSMATIAGIIHQVGDELELPEREALSLVGSGAADQLPGDAPAPAPKQ